MRFLWFIKFQNNFSTPKTHEVLGFLPQSMTQQKPCFKGKNYTRQSSLKVKNARNFNNTAIARQVGELYQKWLKLDKHVH